MKKLFIYLILFIGIGISLSAQKKSNKEKKGDKYAFSYSFDKAIDSYTNAKNLSIDGHRKLADCYHKIGENVQAEKIYAEFTGEKTGILPEDYFNYAMVLKINGKYEEAGIWMKRFKELKPEDLRAEDDAARNNELPGLLKVTGKCKIEHLDINTDALDFGPCYLKNKIVFASSRTDTKQKVKKYNWTQKPFWDMYISEVEGDQLKPPEIFDMGLNGKLNDGPASFSNNGTHMAFTRNHYHDKSKDRVVELQIYFSDFKEGKWTKPEPFFLNKSEYSVGQPCLSSDGITMYFTSDMPGGFGGADIYRIVKDENGAWKEAENLGNKINTEGDEMYPFFEGNNKMLFFSSNGRFGLGGLDIFSCKMFESGFGRVNNAGAPLNTQYDDFAAIVNEKMSRGFFTSDRVGGRGGDDLYSFTFEEPEVMFSVLAPAVIPEEHRVREYFPLRNYIYFNLGSTEIPDRYVLLRQDQVKDFKEEQLEVFTPKEESGHSKRQMVIYYNVLNILGDRMGKNPSTTIKLVGSSEKGPADGKEMALSVMRYLTRVFGIDERRISMEGRYKPKIPSEQSGGKLELALLREGDRRVSVESSSPELLTEFHSGPEAPLKQAEIPGAQEAPPESYVSFNVEGAKEELSSWSLEIMDETGKIKYFGPYSNEKATIPGNDILGVRPEGNFIAKMTGQAKSGKTIIKEAPVHVVQWTPTKTAELMRFSIIYEFNDAVSILIYEKYLTDIVTPKIPKGGKIVIHGYTDIIGDEKHNLKLSLARANDVKNIFEKALSNVNRNDVKIEVYGFGEDENLSPFNNQYPEERFYNRTVIIDIVSNP